MSILFSPFSLKDVTLRNRIAVPPMCQYSAVDGLVNDWHGIHYNGLARGGAGLVIVEATAVSPEGRITPKCLGLWNDTQAEGLSRIARGIKENGAVPGIQIGHAGRKACTGLPWTGGKPVQPEDSDWWQAVGASPLAFSPRHQVPVELSVEGIGEIRDCFARAAQRSLEAGFEWMELHGAHGYLLQSFCSPLSNKRSDHYGGSFENRVRFLIEVVQAVRGVWPERLPLTVRISGYEWVEDGWTLEESVALARLLKAEGVDLVDCSSGGNLPKAPVPTDPGYQVFIAEAVRKGAGIATAAVGLITQAKMADEIVRNGQADLVLLGREMLRSPYWALHAAKELGQPAPVPPQYLRAY